MKSPKYHTITLVQEIRNDVEQIIDEKIEEQKCVRNCNAGRHIQAGHHMVKRKIRDKEFIFMKWFYFTIISTTTIGKC